MAEAEGGVGELTLTFVDGEEMADLNAEHMGGTGATDVLSFPMDDEPMPGVPTMLGDVVVCPEVAHAQFRDHAGTFDDEIALLVVHGVLHVLGHDHAADAEAAVMRERGGGAAHRAPLARWATTRGVPPDPSLTSFQPFEGPDPVSDTTGERWFVADPLRLVLSYVMQISLDGRVALVSGASRGIGRAMATTMARAGADVMLNSRKQDALEATAEEIRAELDGSGHGDVDVFAANAGDDDAGERAVLATIERFGGLDILVNNAATNPYFGPTMEVDKARYDKTFQVNLDGPILWSQAAWKHAFAEKPGVILNVASVGGLRVEFGLGVYNLTKAALIHTTRQLASEIGPTRVVGIAPGLVKTDFAAHLVDNYGETLAARLPTKRLGEPQDIADLATFLVSDSASWITGETYVIDGGAGVSGSSGD